jgi:hypothetical protein
MSIKNLTTYLNDHLAGSVMALEVIQHAAKPSAGTPLARFLEQLHGEIEEDQTMVRDLLRRLDVSENPVKKATAWIAEKAGRVKIDLSDASGALGRLEALETLKLGILGKLALLVALDQVAGEVRPLAGLDFPALQRRAQDQHDRVEAWRLEAAREALSPTADAALP